MRYLLFFQENLTILSCMTFCISLSRSATVFSASVSVLVGNTLVLELQFASTVMIVGCAIFLYGSLKVRYFSQSTGIMAMLSAICRLYTYRCVRLRSSACRMFIHDIPNRMHSQNSPLFSFAYTVFTSCALLAYS